MPITLNTPKVRNETVDKIDLNSLTIDFDTLQAHIGYDELDTLDNVVRKDIIISLTGVPFNAFRQNFNSKTGVSNVRALRLACLEAIRDNAGLAGTVTDNG